MSPIRVIDQHLSQQTRRNLDDHPSIADQEKREVLAHLFQGRRARILGAGTKNPIHNQNIFACMKFSEGSILKSEGISSFYSVQEQFFAAIVPTRNVC